MTSRIRCGSGGDEMRLVVLGGDGTMGERGNDTIG